MGSSKGKDHSNDFIEGDEARSHLLCDFMDYYGRKVGEYNLATDDAKIEGGSIVSNRNVSTSRLAESLGVGNMVAKSETIILQTEDGSITRANSMEGIQADSMLDVRNAAATQKVKLSYTTNSMRQLIMLQILDLISGQVDRHDGNYMVDVDKSQEGIWYVTAIHAIDNDMAFGNLRADQLGRKESRSIKGKDDGKATIGFIPADFYDRLMHYTPEQFAYEQMDIRSKKEIDAMQERLLAVQEQIRSFVADGQIQVLENEEQWQKAFDSMKGDTTTARSRKSYLAGGRAREKAGRYFSGSRKDECCPVF